MSSKREFWIKHIKAWSKSDMAQAEYARQHNLSIKSFGYYRRRYFHEEQKTQPEAIAATLLPVTVVADEQARPTVPEPGITLQSPGGFRIELAAGFDPVALQQVLKALEAS